MRGFKREILRILRVKAGERRKRCWHVEIRTVAVSVALNSLGRMSKRTAVLSPDGDEILFHLIHLRLRLKVLACQEASKQGKQLLLWRILQLLLRW